MVPPGCQTSALLEDLVLDCRSTFGLFIDFCRDPDDVTRLQCLIR